MGNIISFYTFIVIYIFLKNMIAYKIYDNNVQIKDSYQIKWRWEMLEVLEHIMNQLPSSHPVKEKKMNSLLLEWSAHNLLFRLGYRPKQTGSVDLNIGESFLRRLCYFILGWIGFIIPK